MNVGSVFPEACNNVHGHWGWRIVTQQPSEKAVLILDDYAQRFKGKIVRLDVATDLYPDHRGFCRDWVKHHLVLKYRKPGPMLEHDNTTYWVDYRGRSAPTRNLALYCDKLSKLYNRTCVHLEVRLNKGRTLKRLGLDRVRDVISINPAELLPRLVKLYEPRIEGVPAHINRSRKSIDLCVLRLPENLIFMPSRKKVKIAI